MTPTRQGSIRLFRFAGIDVYLNWLVVSRPGVCESSDRAGFAGLAVLAIVEYLALFLIVLMHEFGHALACRQVGGTANRIVLWPLGGVAYVTPPPRPGATLWSIAAGPLVNVALVLFWYCWELSNADGLGRAYPTPPPSCTPSGSSTGAADLQSAADLSLDGGQIFRSLLWFVLGRARSLMVATVVGFVGVVVVHCSRLFHARYPWLAIIAVFILMNCWKRIAAGACAVERLGKLPRGAKGLPALPASSRRSSARSGGATSAGNTVRHV